MSPYTHTNRFFPLTMSSNLDLITVPRCPPGFDCALLNSCPAYIQPCPDGFFCGSYEGLKHQSLMDFRYAEYAYQYVDDVTITHKNKGRYIDPDRVMQAACLDGFYCPDATSMEVSALLSLSYLLAAHFSFFLSHSLSSLRTIDLSCGSLVSRTYCCSPQL